jgi:pyruvate formate lyase activating enzyme
MGSLAEKLDALTLPASLVDVDDSGVPRCLACAHHCRIKPGGRGVCQMRFNRGGQIMAPWGYVAGLNADPIEKKPFMHFLPGSMALTYGMLGCNFHCDFCQNWVSSQALREQAAEAMASAIQPITPARLVESALRSGARVIASSYNEPLITTEWSLDVFQAAKEQGLRCVYVSNGFATPEALRALQSVLDGFKVDLKCITDRQYRELGGRLQVVLDSIALAVDLGIWVEVVTLVIPGFNDSSDDLWQMARYLVSVSAGIPWHVTAFHPMYKRLDGERTSAEILERAAEIGQEAGLNYVYAGNLPGRVGSLENTYCPSCRALLVERSGYHILENRLNAGGLCPDCATPIAGVWG